MKRIILALLLAVNAIEGQAAHSCTLSWLWSQGTGDAAQGFNVKRSLVSGGPYTTIATVGSPSVTTYTDNAVIGGTTYYYVVTSFNSGGESAASNQASCAVPFQAPKPPSALSGVAQ